MTAAGAAAQRAGPRSTRTAEAMQPRYTTRNSVVGTAIERRRAGQPGSVQRDQGQAHAGHRGQEARCRARALARPPGRRGCPPAVAPPARPSRSGRVSVRVIAAAPLK